MACIVIIDEGCSNWDQEDLRAVRQVVSSYKHLGGTAARVSRMSDDLKNTLAEYRSETRGCFAVAGELYFDQPRYTHFTRVSWSGTREMVEFIMVDQDGIMTTITYLEK